MVLRAGGLDDSPGALHQESPFLSKGFQFLLLVLLPRLSAMLTGKLQIHIGRDHRHHTLNLSGVGSVGSAGNVAQIDQCIKGMFLSSSSHHTS